MTVSYDIVMKYISGGGRGKVADLVVSRIGESLKAARTRLGWSRETLAHHSGVSWSAIAQIESGRRKDVRLSSLSALADALKVSVDYLIGTEAAMSSKLLEHRVLTYSTDEDFLAATVPYIIEGAARSDPVLAVATRSRIGLLRDALGDASDHVEFADAVDWYSSPNAATDRYREFVEQKYKAGAGWIRIAGEPAWGGSDTEVTTWTRYESLINVSFASSPATILCLYDTRSLPAGIVAHASRTHPEIVHDDHTTASAAYEAPADFLLS
jgi:transcriptional regulator with XRE-family HTH domain